MSRSQNQQFDSNQRAVKVLNKPVQTVGAFSSARRCGVAQQDQTQTCRALSNASERPFWSPGT